MIVSCLIYVHHDWQLIGAGLDSVPRHPPSTRKSMPALGSPPVPTRPLYTAEQRRRRDASGWTLVRGVLAPIMITGCAPPRQAANAPAARSPGGGPSSKASASSSSPIRSSRSRSRASSRVNSACSSPRSARPTCTASTSPMNSRCCTLARCCRKGRTWRSSSTAAAPPGPTSWSAASAWRTRTEPGRQGAGRAGPGTAALAR